MTLEIYFNPLDKACKSITGAVRQNEVFTLNIFNLYPKANAVKFNNTMGINALKTPSKEECISPTETAYLHLNRDGEEVELYEMEKTAFGWTISLQIPEIGLFFYSFEIENNGFISCGNLEIGHLTSKVTPFLLTVC